jgi:hypothetical protein
MKKHDTSYVTIQVKTQDVSRKAEKNINIRGKLINSKAYDYT